MKRSEMLKLIVTAIDMSCGNDGETRLYPDDSYLAFNILKTIEEAGMLPCSFYWRSCGEYSPAHEAVDHINNDAEIGYFDWEPEE